MSNITVYWTYNELLTRQPSICPSSLHPYDTCDTKGYFTTWIVSLACLARYLNLNNCEPESYLSICLTKTWYIISISFLTFRKETNKQSEG